jgi:hypothetical protein
MQELVQANGKRRPRSCDIVIHATAILQRVNSDCKAAFTVHQAYEHAELQNTAFDIVVHPVIFCDSASIKTYMHSNYNILQLLEMHTNKYLNHVLNEHRR